MRSMTLITLLLLTQTVLSQTAEKQTKVVPPPPPLPTASISTKTPKKKVERPKREASRRKRVGTTAPASVKRNRPTVVLSKQSATLEESKSTPTQTDTSVATSTNSQPVDSETDSRPMKAGERIPFMAEDKNPKANEAVEGNIWLTVLGAIGIVLGLLFAGTWVVRKFGLFGVPTDVTIDNADLELVSSITPRPGQTISVIRFDGHQLLVGSTEHSFTLLAQSELPASDSNVSHFPAPVPVSSLLPDESGRDFEDQLVSAREALQPTSAGEVK